MEGENSWVDLVKVCVVFMNKTLKFVFSGVKTTIILVIQISSKSKVYYVHARGRFLSVINVHLFYIKFDTL